MAKKEAPLDAITQEAFLTFLQRTENKLVKSNDHLDFFRQKVHRLQNKIDEHTLVVADAKRELLQFQKSYEEELSRKNILKEKLCQARMKLNLPIILDC